MKVTKRTKKVVWKLQWNLGLTLGQLHKLGYRVTITPIKQRKGNVRR